MQNFGQQQEVLEEDGSVIFKLIGSIDEKLKDEDNKEAELMPIKKKKNKVKDFYWKYKKYYTKNTEILKPSLSSLLSFAVKNSSSNLIEKGFDVYAEVDDVIIYEDSCLMLSKNKSNGKMKVLSFDLIQARKDKKIVNESTRSRGISDIKIVLLDNGIMININTGEALFFDKKYIPYLNKTNSKFIIKDNVSENRICSKPQKVTLDLDPFSELGDVIGVKVNKYGVRFSEQCFKKSAKVDNFSIALDENETKRL